MAAEKLIQEQADFFKKGASLEEARQMGVGFLYEDSKGTVEAEPEEKLEDMVPDLPENQKVREFLKKAPTKGLFMPLGQEVKCMQCWRCKGYGHRTGDRECPMAMSGNLLLDAERQAREDPMSTFVGKKFVQSREKELRRQQLSAILDDIRREKKEKKKKKKRKKKDKKKSRKKDKKRKKCEESSTSSSSSDDDSSSSSSEDESRPSSRDEKRRRKKKHKHKHDDKE